jgi:predicted nucleic acid-binding Zn ribbon protein
VPTDPDDPTHERWPRDEGSSTADELYPQAGPQRRGSAAARAEPDWWDVAEESGAGIERAAADEPPPAARPRRKRATPAAGGKGKSGPGAPAGDSAAASASKISSAEPTPGAADSASQGAAEAVSGPELARAVIDAALTKRREAARNPRRRTGEGTGKRLRGYSGPGPDPRDPQLFGAVLGRLMKARGWEKPKAEATVFGAWEKVVGAEIANHSRPIKLDDGVLTVEAESTAWATQLRMLAAGLLRSIAAEVGHNVVTKLNIHGPAAPSWAKGPRRVQGRGPRDTYG